MPKPRPIEDRFWEKVDKNGPDGCWVWTGCKTGRGYGSIYENGLYVAAHRVVYKLLVGTIPKGMEIDHICSRKLCVNPSHLRLCTPSENKINKPIDKNNKSGLKGVSWEKRRKKWRAQIGMNKRNIYLGYFPTKELAHSAYLEAAKTLFGEFVYHAAIK